MRTNTWLGLQMVQSELNHFDLMGQLTRMEAAQAERDRLREEKFDRAAAIAQRGQFLMWIQSPEGQVFDRWELHAHAASQSLEDREAAWEFAWYAEHIEASEGTDHAILAPFGTNSPWDVLPWHRQLQGPQVSVVGRLIDDFANAAHESMPRPNELISLSGTYFSYSVECAETITPLPRSLRDLLEKFQAEDEQRVAALHADGFC